MHFFRRGAATVGRAPGACEKIKDFTSVCTGSCTCRRHVRLHIRISPSTYKKDPPPDGGGSFSWICYTVLIEFRRGGFTCPLGGFNRGQGGSLAQRGFKVNKRGCQFLLKTAISQIFYDRFINITNICNAISTSL